MRKEATPRTSPELTHLPRPRILPTALAALCIAAVSPIEARAGTAETRAAQDPMVIQALEIIYDESIPVQSRFSSLLPDGTPMQNAAFYARDREGERQLYMLSAYASEAGPTFVVTVCPRGPSNHANIEVLGSARPLECGSDVNRVRFADIHMDRTLDAIMTTQARPLILGENNDFYLPQGGGLRRRHQRMYNDILATISRYVANINKEQV